MIEGFKLTWYWPVNRKPDEFERGQVWGPGHDQAVKVRYHELTLDNVTEVGRMLLRENHRSVQHRYDEGPKVELSDPYSFKRYRGQIKPVQVLKAIGCLDYQSCEHPGWKDSEAYAFLEALLHTAIDQLPGYEEADWEIH